MPLRKRPLDRDAGIVKDANLIIIASEDKYAVEQYFGRFKVRRSQFLPLPTLDSRSAPQHVLDRLHEYKEGTATEENDTFWLCVDRDRWPDHVLAEVFRECLRRGYGIVLSSPCFELWLLLHFEEVAGVPRLSCEEVSARLGMHLNPPRGGYGKQCCKSAKLTKEMVEAAIQRAKAMYHGELLVPDENLSQVYRIFDELLRRDLIELV